VLRLDLVHPLVSGNKWFKLKHNLALARQQGHNTVLSYGGAYSNHLVAMAAAAKLSGLHSIGVVRGEINDPSNPVLAFVRGQGMVLHSVSRGEYRQKHDVAFQVSLQQRYGRFFDIPEGGGNALGLVGTAEIAQFLRFSPASQAGYVLLPCGTAATLAGIITKLHGAHRVLGISVLRGDDTLSPQVSNWLRQLGCNAPCHWEISNEFHCGGYAKRSAALMRDMERFTAISGIPLEPVYTGKMIHALYQLIERGFFPQGSDIIAVHTGGMVAQSMW
jgi:1-aminocyclopropane-1-carboxylate deaminase/D-cysteine desulfhydrase-like pyridoxal-dependent ACC family enzyme